MLKGSVLLLPIKRHLRNILVCIHCSAGDSDVSARIRLSQHTNCIARQSKQVAINYLSEQESKTAKPMQPDHGTKPKLFVLTKLGLIGIWKCRNFSLWDPSQKATVQHDLSTPTFCQLAGPPLQGMQLMSCI